MNQYIHPGKRLGSDQARQPEAHTGDAQHHWPQLRLCRGEGTQRRISAQQCPRTRSIDLPGIVTAPVIEGDRQVIQHRPRAGVVEVDQTGQVGAFEQHVVAEQVGVQVGARQGHDLRVVLSDLVQASL
ncbi:hypothetical protein D3C76_1257410 [compost metagenome]